VVFNLLVLLDCRLPGGWKISTAERTIPPLTVSTDLENIIHHHRNELSEEDRNDPTFVADSDIWPVLCADERLVALEVFEGPVRPAFTTGTAATLVGMVGVSGRSPSPSAQASQCLLHTNSQHRERLLHQQG
jgi:hypothetical protein